MEKKRLFFDMDNVLVNFQSGLDKVDETVKAQYRAKTSDGKDRLDEIPGLFSLMEPMEGAVDAVCKLAEVYDVFILSTAPWNNPSAWSDKVEWVKKYFDSEDKDPSKNLFHKRMIITHRKDLCEGDYLIDDRGKNGTSEFKGEWIQFGSERFPNWNSILEYLLPDIAIMKTSVGNESSLTIEEELPQKKPFVKWFEKKCKNPKEISSIVWKLVIVFEIIALIGIRSNSYIWGIGTLGGVAITVLLIFILWRTSKKLGNEYKYKSVILTKLLANAIAPNKLGTIYLLLFVIHIGWITNAAMSLYIDSNLLKVIATIAICGIGMGFLILFFPNRKEKSNGALNDIVVSGISALNPKFLKTDLDLFNLVPFVRIFQQANASKIVVVMSDFFIKEGYRSPSIFITEESYPQLFSDIEMIINENQVNEKWTDSQNFLSQYPFIKEKQSIQKEGKRTEVDAFSLKLGDIDGITRNVESIKNDLIKVIKETACIQFYDKPKMIEVINACSIEFTEFIADYNDFQASFNQVNDLVQSLDDVNTNLYFNLTPGTVTMSSVMSLIAIDGDRRLFYYSQDKGLPLELRLKEVYKNQIPLENLLSQALENVTKSK